MIKGKIMTGNKIGPTEIEIMPTERNLMTTDIFKKSLELVEILNFGLLLLMLFC